MEWAELPPVNQLDGRCAGACPIVAHAAMGSTISALAAGKPIVILPRSARLRETRSEHQFATTPRFSRRPSMVVAWTPADHACVVDWAVRNRVVYHMKTLRNSPQRSVPDDWGAILYGRRRSR